MTDRQRIAAAVGALVGRAVERVSALVGGAVSPGAGLVDDHQVVVERVAYAATEARVVEELAKAPAEVSAAACVAAAELAVGVLGRLAPVLGVGLAYEDEVRGVIEQWIAPGVVEAVGLACWPLDGTLHDVRTSVRAFAEREIAPIAGRIHREDGLIPERLIEEIGKLGYFGLSIPEEYGGHALGHLAMILTTEELARASLAVGGSLITRPEILAKALLAGGTADQKRTWLPRLAAGEIMAAISVTEPDVGSDVAAVACRAERVNGGWSVTGQKAWCTFAGRADVIALLARTDGGLALFIVDKPRFAGKVFEATQASGGTLSGRAERTPGYRGMGSFGLAFDRWFVPEAQLVGGEAGIGRGFALQMAGFAAGRLQTGGRACGLVQAAIDETARYVAMRSQFGRPIGEWGLTKYQLGRMTAKLVAARAITYAAAAAMDGDERSAAPVAAMAKLFACDVAVEVTQMGQLLHGGWGYAEEAPICRYVADAQVLPIFEGVKPILTLKVVGRSLLAR